MSVPLALGTAPMLAAVALALLSTAQKIPVDPVRTGLDWLAAQQRPDGSWAGSDSGARTWLTAVAGMALFMEGSTTGHGRYRTHLGKAVAWMEQDTQTDGRIGGRTVLETLGQMHDHPSGLLFLASAYDLEDNHERRARLGKLVAGTVAYTIKRQSTNGGWGVNAGDPGDLDATAQILRALLVARRVGFDVPRAVTDAGAAFLGRAVRPGDPMLATRSAAAMAAYPGPRPPSFAAWLPHAAPWKGILWPADGSEGRTQVAFETAVLAHALGEVGHTRIAPAARQVELLRWAAYREEAFRHIRAAQTPDGYWPRPAVGPVYHTALALIALQLDNGYVPAFAR